MQQIGRELGNYRLVRLIGTGGFGGAYLGEHIHSGTQAIVKVLEVRTKEDAERFLAEARIIARLVHPNIIRVLDFGAVDEHTAFFVTTYAPNGTLRHHYRKGVPYPLTIILPHIKQIASALQYTHDQGIVHCDVKPDHFLLDDNSDVLLCDFGLNASKQNMRGNDTMEERVWKKEEKEGMCDSPNHFTPVRCGNPERTVSTV